MYAGRIRGITVGDESNVFVFIRRADSFFHGDGGRQSITRVIDMVRRYFTSFRRQKKESISILARDFNVGFITRLSRVNRTLKFQIEFVAMRSGVMDIIENGLIRSWDTEYIFEDKGGFPG